MGTLVRRAGPAMTLGGATVVGSQILWGGVAAADHDVSSCDSGEVCLFESDGFNENAVNHIRHDIATTDPKFDTGEAADRWWDGTSDARSDDNMDNELSSIKNKGTRCSVTVFQNGDYGGARTTIRRGAGRDGQDANLGDNNVGDNRASSVDFCWYENGGDPGDFS